MTPLFKKLNYKGQKEVLITNAPASFKEQMDALRQSSKVAITHHTSQCKQVEFAMAFVTTQDAIDQFITEAHHKFEGDATVWMCYPKASSKKYQCDFNRDTGFGVLGDHGFEGVRQVAVDQDWSALRFRKVEYIKKITRRESYALTVEAKQRTSNRGK